ncbi:hypothetical protein CIG75_05100 [Tumebacillus algifaecis]|uniref:Uncharacterized protein n=1 Tax=Tumebacillus algifaecis TaxID=1214604 RepID=A0A223CYT8_9BACL|nr:hypothetical protein [Tumebacillus algifaecis]ASS74425.1 hypothetical protein CIG75_05100 [Tumebacillus algifaecis]
MTKFKTILTATALAALTMSATAYAGNEHGAVDSDIVHSHPAGHDHSSHQHQHKAPQKQLGELEKQALVDAGIDLKQLQVAHEQIRVEFDNLRAHSNAIHEKVSAAKDEKLQAQVKQDLEKFRSIMQQLQVSKQEYRTLKQELRTAAEAKDKSKIKATFAKLQTSQQDVVKLLQAADKELQKELTKLQ